VKASGVNGIVYTAEPLNACGPLTIKAVEGPPSPFALIIRGGCTFDEKVKNAQDAGFKAAIVYDNENSGVLVSSNLPSHPHSLLLQFLNAICVAA
jgi:E3 ubiquitin-protein ligase RNF13